MQNPDVFTIWLSAHINQVRLKFVQHFRHNNKLKKYSSWVLTVNKTNLAMLKKLLYIISRYLMYLFFDLLICFFVAIMASDSMYLLDMIEGIVNKGLRLGDISFFCTMYSNCPWKSIQNFLMTCCFIELSCFLLTLSISWIFY